MMNSWQRRLSRLEQKLLRGPTVQDIERMTDAELLCALGLPPDAPDDAIAAYAKWLEHDLARADQRHSRRGFR